MLVLSRKVGERILVGKHIVITVVDSNNGSVRLGIDAPRDLTILREEVPDRNTGKVAQAPLSYIPGEDE